MAEQNLDVIVTPQNTGHSMDFQANTRYLTHCGGGGDADIAAVFPLHGAVTAIATSANPRWTTTQEWTTDVREARREYGKIIVERLKELKVDHGRIGITGLGEVEGTRTPEGTILHGTWQRIRDAFPNAQLVDATPILVEVRYIKSAEEIQVLTQSMAIVEEGYKAEIEAARARRPRLGCLGRGAVRHDAQRLGDAGALQLDLRQESRAHPHPPEHAPARARRLDHQ